MDNKVRPLVFVYDTDREKYAQYSNQYKFLYGNPTFFRSVETLRYDYIIANHQHIIDAYAKHGIKNLELFDKNESKPAKQAQKPVKEETKATPPVEEDKPSQDDTEAQEEDLESLSWAELRKKAQDAGLEGRFGKEEAIKFLKSQ